LQKEFLAFWYDGNHNRVDVVTIIHPPHEEPRGAVLEALLIDGLARKHEVEDPMLHGAVELSAAAWAAGQTREVVIGDGYPVVVECTGGAWRVITTV
jgi:hypothetical protein